MTEIISAAASLDDLTAQIKIKLVENHVLTNAFNRNINQNSVAIGQYLTQAKKLVPYKQWQIWLDENFKMTKQAAGNYIRVAEFVGNLKNVFQVEEFNFAALIELTKIPTAELQKFLAENPNVDKLSVRNLREKIRNWKVPASLTVEVDAEIKPLKLPPPSFSKVPNVLLEAAKAAGVEVSMNFSRALQPADSDILITRINAAAIDFYSAVADCVIFAAPMEFVRSDNAVKKLRPAIWYFGGVAQIFYQHFSNFGNLFLPAKKPADSAGEVKNLINNCGQIITFKGGRFNG